MVPSLKSEVNLMPGPKPPAVHLSDEERHGLEKLVSKHKTPQQIALRGRIVLATADGKRNAQIASAYRPK
jgi:hypothetical protein